MNMLKKIAGVFSPKNTLCLVVGIVVAVAVIYCLRKFAGLDLVGKLPGMESFEEDYESDEEEPEMFENEYDEDFEDKPEEEKTGASRIVNALTGVQL
jgi:hypothetical protein